MRVVELFSGIGAQIKGVADTNLFKVESVAISEIDKDAVSSYAAIHCGFTPEMVASSSCPSHEEMVNYLNELNLGYDFENDKAYNWGKYKESTIKKYYLACKLTNNLGDISRIKHLPACDLLTFSAPCTDISKAGLCKGMDKGTRSGLVWEILRLLSIMKSEGKLPKYLFMENVKNLVNKSFIKDFDALNKAICDFNYNVYWKVLSAEDCGIPQKRERVFAIYIRRDIDTGLFEFPSPIPLETRAVDYMEEEVEERYVISPEKLKQFIENTGGEVDLNSMILGTCHYSNDIKHCTRELIYNSLTSAPTLLASMYKVAPYIMTLNNGVHCQGNYHITDENIRVHRLSPKECWRLMGFTDTDFEACKAFKESNAVLRKQAGNSIVINCVKLIFEHLYKAQYDFNYICSDKKVMTEKMNELLSMLNS